MRLTRAFSGAIVGVIVGALLATALPLAAAAQSESRLIPNDGQWTLTSVPGGGCFARLGGNQVDTMVMVNRDANPVLSIGRPDWQLGTKDFAVSLSINGGPAHELTVSPIGTVLLVALNDPTLKDQVLKATGLTWTLPNGRFTASVLGIGKAFKAVVPCGLAAAKATPPATAPAP